MNTEKQQILNLLNDVFGHGDSVKLIAVVKALIFLVKESQRSEDIETLIKQIDVIEHEQNEAVIAEIAKRNGVKRIWE